MGKSKGKRGGVKRLGMEVDVAENVTGTDLTAKDKLRMKMEKKNSLKVQIVELKKTRAKIGKGRDRRMERREVVNKLKDLKSTVQKASQRTKHPVEVGKDDGDDRHIPNALPDDDTDMKE